MIHTDARPNMYPSAEPTIICTANVRSVSTQSKSPCPPPPASDTSSTVRIYAMGSLLPLSNSNIGLRFCRSPCFFERRIENTEAESVDDMVAASSRAATNDISMPTYGATK